MYDVALLIEHQLTKLDVQQVTALHEGLDDTVTYHVLLPVEDAAAELATSLGALGGIEMMGSPSTENLGEMQRQATESCRGELEASVELLEALGQKATGTLTRDDPVDALYEIVKTHDSAEAIIVTEPHLVSEFFHIDWTSRARRKLEVPTLHLLEHETFDEQASGGGEGATVL